MVDHAEHPVYYQCDDGERDAHPAHCQCDDGRREHECQASAGDSAGDASRSWQITLPAVQLAPLTPSYAAILELLGLGVVELPGSAEQLLCLESEAAARGGPAAAARHYAAAPPAERPLVTVACRELVVRPVRRVVDTATAAQWSALYRAVGHPCFVAPAEKNRAATEENEAYVVLASHCGEWCEALAAAPSGALCPAPETIAALGSIRRVPLPAGPVFPPWFGRCFRREANTFVLRLARALGQKYVRVAAADKKGYDSKYFDVRLDAVAEFIAAHPRALSTETMLADA